MHTDNTFESVCSSQLCPWSSVVVAFGTGLQSHAALDSACSSLLTYLCASVFICGFVALSIRSRCFRIALRTQLQELLFWILHRLPRIRGVRRRMHRQPNAEGAALAQTVAGCLDFAAVLIDDAMTDRQAQPRSLAGSAAREERLENIL